MHTVDNLARWGRNYLLTSPSVQDMVSLASQNDVVAQAALCILSKSNSSIVNGQYCTISQQRAKAAISEGIGPPYRLTFVRREQMGDGGNVQEETCIFEINEKYVQTLIFKQSSLMDDLLTEFLD